jgi:hypothetical protein
MTGTESESDLAQRCLPINQALQLHLLASYPLDESSPSSDDSSARPSHESEIPQRLRLDAVVSLADGGFDCGSALCANERVAEVERAAVFEEEGGGGEEE